MYYELFENECFEQMRFWEDPASREFSNPNFNSNEVCRDFISVIEEDCYEVSFI